jgi:hypothetical protein
MLKKITILTIGLMFIISTMTMAQWENHKMHFPQLPDEIGWDLEAFGDFEDPGNGRLLADDWQCSETGWVQDIHFWGSWKDLDDDPMTDDFEAEYVYFTLNIYSDLPVGHPDNPHSYSIPGDQLWTFMDFIQGTQIDPSALEGWIYPGDLYPDYNDHIRYWQYDFIIPEQNWFHQEAGSIYWLGITANLFEPYIFEWGWKNSRDHFADAAVYRTEGDDWQIMYEPPRYNEISVSFNEFGEPTDDGSTNYYGDGWYYFPQYDWWNIWFYDNPYSTENAKHIDAEVFVTQTGPDPQITFAINYSNAEWSDLGLDRPPLPSDFQNPPYEDDYIIREEIDVDIGYNVFPLDISWNPEWVSVDLRAQNVSVECYIYHECVTTPLDLSFVITGEPDEQIPTLNEWGMILLAFLLLAGGTIAIIRRRRLKVIES